MLVISLIPSLKLVNKNVTENTQKEELFKGKKIKNIERDIEIQDVAFKYNDSNQILNNLNLVIPRNKISAIVGPSGVGKTSIADLLMGLYFSNKGKIIINDTDIRGLQLASWRQLIGYVSQDTFIYNASIKENILIGNPYATNEEVIEASKMANAHEFIKNMKNNYNTIVGDRGIKMSGGQRQRIAIARAVVRKPKLFIFDEATSSLDNKSEALVQRSINKIGGKNTVLIITHRLSNVKKADVIFFLNEGEIKENGTFEELINKKGAFFSMYNESI